MSNAHPSGLARHPASFPRFQTTNGDELMKKTIAALACLAALAAHAQSSVTLYGSADIALTWTSNGQGTALPGAGPATPASTRRLAVDSGIGPGSRIGFRGREDLGGGLAGVFLAEMGMDLSSGVQQQGGAAFGRQIFVGLSGTNWTLTAGRQYSPLDIAYGVADAFNGVYWGNVVGASGHGNYQSLGSVAGSGTHNSTARVDNSVQGTMTFGPVTGKLMYALGNEGTNKAGRLINPAISYVQGPVNVQASYLRLKTPASMLVAGANPESMTEWVVGGSYDFGPAKLSTGVYEFRGPRDRTRIAAIATPGAAGASPFAYDWREQRAIWLSASAPVGPGVVSLSVSRHRYDYATGPDGRSWVFGARYEHFLSKRTSLYVSAGKVLNDGRARTPLVSTISAVVPNGFGSDPRAASIGMQHRF